MPDRGRGYDHNHATMLSQHSTTVIILVVLFAIGILGGLALALFSFGLLT